MKLTAGKASRIVWITAASLFVVLAVIGGYVLVSHNNQAAEKASECSKQMQDDLTLDSVLCSRTSQ